MILVSSCLAGYKCAYDGKDRKIEKIVELVKAGKAIVVCPEQLGGLKTPRQSAECIKIHGGVMVMTKDGEDVTAEFLKGAKETLNIAKLYNCKYGILKKNSPSCGLRTYDGSFTGTLSDMRGLTADMLLKNGIEVISSEDEEGIKRLLLKD